MTSWNTLQERMSWALMEAGLKQNDLVVECGIKKQVVNQWVKGSTKHISGAYLICVSKKLGVDSEWLNTGKGKPRQNLASIHQDFRELPVVSYVQAGDFSAVFDEHPMGYGMETITTNLEDLGEYTFALRVKGDSMLPEFREGDIVVIDPSVEPVPGDFVVAKLDRDESATFKKYRPDDNDKDGYRVFDLVPLNKDWPIIHINNDNPGRIIGVMVEYRRFRQKR